MTKKKKTWAEKLRDSKDLPKNIPMPDKLIKSWGKGKMLIPAPIEVDAVMKKVRKGRLITMDAVARYLASKHGAQAACPMTTGIFAWIAAHAAAEARELGQKRITPYWRTLKSNGELNPKYPGGIENLKVHLEQEGHVIEQRGKRFFVNDYQSKIICLDGEET